MSGRLEGRCAVITGAARGIGRAVAVAMAREGADVAGIDIVVRAPRYEEISLANWLAHVPPELVMQHFNLTRQDLEKFPKGARGIAPA
ncbi:MAG TPA: SDR family NAD(P)-dependent oxidoreductase [Gemmatimonadaceae bacterium]